MIAGGMFRRGFAGSGTWIHGSHLPRAPNPSEKKTGDIVKKIKISLAIATIAVGALALPAGAATAADLGGWDESAGAFAHSSSAQAAGGIAVAAAPNHRGAAEEKSINGTTHKRAKGWTTWVGVYHYTTAQMKHGNTVLTTSGRQWGKSGTQATSPWFKANTTIGKGSARSYYGK
jgi:hypothetical protein